MPILMLEKDDEKAELEFEVSYQLSLTPADRFEMIKKPSKVFLQQQIEHGYKKSFEIVKRR